MGCASIGYETVLIGLCCATVAWIVTGSAGAMTSKNAQILFPGVRMTLGLLRALQI